MVNPYVGILINDSLYAGIPLGNTKYEAIHFYSDAGKQFGITPCYFRMQDVHIHTMRVHAYVQRGIHYIREWIDMPKVIHNRAVYLDPGSDQELESWTQHGIHVFNRWNRYSKLQIHEILLQDEVIRPHLPATFPATLKNMKVMMSAYDSIIIKPTNSSIGRGVMKMDRTPAGWQLIYPATLKINNKIWREVRFRKQLPLTLLRKIQSRAYLVQQRLPLATYDRRPFDLRIAVQRGASGDWGVTGIVAKVASHKLFLTNVAQGGEVKTLTDILAAEYPSLDPSAVFEQITAFALRVAKFLSMHLPHLADLGLDVGITTAGYPLFIECNGKDQRYSFREGNMLEAWKATYYNPMAYAKFLLGGGTPVY
ncbi:YheC/YheD family endospore coat-associated protein [Paenibacillus planticolens]|uniref:YheC/YheD family protein n=1 Tax=Paenibacillus planticolens TaxID=2654976 RepID=A0ABX1ZWT4_9BACL|nr:YheC/YheD family protein [Paenibacillus planticolens]NOV04286.1 YheC/YheD family protein [Paenibacillus planticolens]